ncbi:hypothetical protein [Algoriphagus sp.]|uniref:hypothetical protein n=1 Tax=Algoriphagus sp. TaxID=1872435 RepID=UPI00391C7F7F
MKKTLLFLVFVSVFSIDAFAQEQGDTRIHALGTYNLRFGEFGVGAGAEYFFIDKFAVMPSFVKYFPQVGNTSNFSFDLRYYVTEGPSQLYFMAGYSQTFENNQPGQPGTKRDYVGANVGVGAYIVLTEWVGLSTEFRFQSQFRQESGFRLGFAFPL